MGTFINSFIRQLGRETAHDLYNKTKTNRNILGIKDMSLCSDIGIEHKCSNTKLYLIIYCLPFLLSELGIIISLFYMHNIWNKKVTRYWVYKSVPQFKADRRYANGYKYLGDTLKKHYFDKVSTKDEIDERHSIIKNGLCVYAVLFIVSLLVLLIAASY